MPGRDTLPEDIQAMIDYAKAKGVKLMAYAYPSLPFMQNPVWTRWRTEIGEEPQGYLTVDTGLKSFQDWWVNLLVAFYEQTGIAGYSFDHWWIAYTDTTGLVSSKYQQWYGTRRILGELRKRAPEMIIDGRQQYHHFGTWTWLAGTYPHPMMSDEQPGSFHPFPDLSTDRISADRQRYVAHRLMIRDFTPVEILPGFITHQTQRSDADRVMRRDSYRTRDWDYLGWQYSLISTVATAPCNLVINYLPARDTAEFNHFGQNAKDFFIKWLKFTDDHLPILKKVRPILGQPMVGRCDGTAAIDQDQGYIFLFNPNYREVPVEVVLNRSIGLESGSRFLIQQIYPAPEMNIGHSEKGFFGYGDTLALQLTGTTASVFQIIPQYNDPESPLLFNAPGSIQEHSNRLLLSDVKGITGSTQPILIYHPGKESIKEIEINGSPVSFNQEGKIIQLEVKFAGTLFRKAAQIDYYESDREGNEFEWMVTVSQRIKDQLSARKLAWPVHYTSDDLLAPWVDPSRLLLFINIADPDPEMIVDCRLLIDDLPVRLVGAYNGVYPYEKRTFLGFYADVSFLSVDEPHAIHLKLPEGLRAGQFQGVFFGNVEDEYTNTLSASIIP